MIHPIDRSLIYSVNRSLKHYDDTSCTGVFPFLVVKRFNKTFNTILRTHI
ncbi:hypothetical protein [Pelodictyon phaeoclathratiforme]|nr:hypothetical protein [Pelodictyon phaeoclathratiforme]MBV5289334.1 hypothetical protein [Pelodictyon phaeoclathratiforme]